MPTYKSKSNKTEVIYYDRNFLPGIETVSKRYINLDRYPFLMKVSDSPYKGDILLLNDIESPAISSRQDMIRDLMFYVADDAASDGDTLTVAVIIGDTDDIKQSFILKTIDFERIKISDTLSLWKGSCTHEEWGWPIQALFYHIAVITINVSAPIKIYAKSII